MRKKVKKLYLFPMAVEAYDDLALFFVGKAKEMFKVEHPEMVIDGVSWTHTHKHNEFSREHPALRVVVTGKRRNRRRRIESTRDSSR